MAHASAEQMPENEKTTLEALPLLEQVALDQVRDGTYKATHLYTREVVLLPRKGEWTLECDDDNVVGSFIWINEDTGDFGDLDVDKQFKNMVYRDAAENLYLVDCRLNRVVASDSSCLLTVSLV